MSDEVAHGSASPVPAGRVQSAAGAASAAAGSKARGATRQSRAPSSGRYVRAAARTRTTGRRRRRRTIRAQVASEDGIADATAPSEPTSEALLHLPTEFVHPTASQTRWSLESQDDANSPRAIETVLPGKIVPRMISPRPARRLLRDNLC